MPKLNTYTVKPSYSSITELIAIIPGSNGAFETIRLPYSAVKKLIEDLAPSGSGGGKDGREVELIATSTHIQWRYVGELVWTNLVALSDLRGAGVPSGGSTGQVLTKKSAAENDTHWTTPTSGGGGTKPIITIPWANSITLDLATGENFFITMAGHTQLFNPVNAVDGQKFNVYIKQHVAGSLTLMNWGLKWKFAGGVKVMTPTANAVDLLRVQYVASLDQFLTEQIQAFA